MIKYFKENYEGKSFRGHWEGSPIFHIGEAINREAKITWGKNPAEDNCFYFISDILDNFKQGVWILN
jgi:hypothetical protein